MKSLGDSFQVISCGPNGSQSVIILWPIYHPWGLENLKDSFEGMGSIGHVRLDGYPTRDHVGSSYARGSLVNDLQVCRKALLK